MATILRMDMPRPADGRRWLVGLLVSSKCTDVAVALVGASGRGLDARIDVAGTLEAAIPGDVPAMLNLAAETDSIPAGTISVCRSLLAEVQAALVTDLLASLGIAPSRVLAVGVHDPGLWRFERHKPSGYLGLCDPARLADATGLNVIDGFPARDVAQGGQGGPITAVAEWVMLKAPARNRVLLDLGRTVHLTYLPSASAENAPSRILGFDVGPGTALLDLLAQRLSGGQHAFDPGGRLAVQGRRIGPLIEHWLRDPYYDRPVPRWHPRGVLPERFLAEAVQLAVEHDWSVRDLLCSATHLVAETIGLTLRKRLPEDVAIDEIVVTGGGQHNGMLLREIGQLTGVPVRRVGDFSVSDEALGPASVAVLALLHVDQVPANHTAITGAAVPRLLGRLTPGSPQNWQRLLQTSAETAPAVRPLRVAL